MTDQKKVHESRWTRYRALAIAALVSIAAHLTLAWLASGTLEKQEKGKRTQPITLVIRDPNNEIRVPKTELDVAKLREQPVDSIEPDAERPPPDERPIANNQGVKLDRGRSPLDFPDFAPAPAPSQPQSSSQTGSSGSDSGVAAKADTRGGDNVDLFKRGAIDKTAKTFGTPEETTEGPNLPSRGDSTPQERANSAMDRMRTDQAELQHAHKLERAPPELVALQTQAEGRFDPPSAAVAASRQKCKTCEHEVGHLFAMVDVSRTADDNEPVIIVSQPSGDKAFDASAVLAVKAALPKGPASYIWSRWRFGAEVYRWSATDMLLDPSFTPPGRRLPTPGSLGAMSMTTSVKLVGFR